MQKKSQGLTNYQITAIVTVNIIGFIALSLPGLAASKAGIDGVLATIAAGILSAVLAGLIILLCKRFPNQTVIEFSQEILGRFLGRLYGAAFAFYAIITASVIIRGFADAMKVLLLQRTPIELLMIAMIFISIYCVVGGISTIAKVSELFLPAIVGVIGLIILFNLTDVELFRFRNILSEGWLPIFRGIFNITLAYLGYEILFFLSPVMKNKNKLLPYGLAGLILPVLTYTGLVFVALGINGEKTTSDMIYPTVQLTRRIALLGTFIERFDIFFIMFWILAVFTSAVMFLYIASISVTRLAGLRNYKPFIFMLAPVIYIFAILPQNIVQINLLTQIANYAGLFIVFSSAPMLLLSLIRKKGGKHHG
jgi:spore germination protein